MSKSIEKRLEKIEEVLGRPDEPPRVLVLVWFGNRENLPPERREGNQITRFVHIDDVYKSENQRVAEGNKR